MLLRVEKWPVKLSSWEAVDDETANSNIGNVLICDSGLFLSIRDV